MSHANRAAAQGAAPWPGDAGLIKLMQEHRSFTQVAKACGKARETLRDYLRLRPELLEQLHALRPAKYTDEQRKAAISQSRREWLERNREYRRARRREWMRKKRSDPESIQYELFIRRDPCSYCGGPTSGTTDHIEPRARGGEDHWSNYTPACGTCNDSKGSKPLLMFLLDRAEVIQNAV